MLWPRELSPRNNAKKPLGWYSLEIHLVNVMIQFTDNIQSTFEKHGLELCRSIYMRMSFSKYIGHFFRDLGQLKKKTDELCNLEIKKKRYVMNIYNICKY